MKTSKNEKLSEYLMSIDEELIANAYNIDDAEKLKQYVKQKNNKNKKTIILSPAFRRFATAAACFVLIFGIGLSLIPTTSTTKNPDPNPLLPKARSDQARSALLQAKDLPIAFRHSFHAPKPPCNLPSFYGRFPFAPHSNHHERCLPHKTF